MPREWGRIAGGRQGWVRELAPGPLVAQGVGTLNQGPLRWSSPDPIGLPPLIPTPSAMGGQQLGGCWWGRQGSVCLVVALSAECCRSSGHRKCVCKGGHSPWKREGPLGTNYFVLFQIL